MTRPVGRYPCQTHRTGPDEIQSYSAGRPASPNLRTITDCETLAAISLSEEPVSTFWSEYRNNDIRFVGVGLFNRILIAVLKRLPLLLALVLVLLAYVVYRRYSTLYRGDSGEAGLRRTGAGADDPSTGEDEEPSRDTGSGSGGSDAGSDDGGG